MSRTDDAYDFTNGFNIIGLGVLIVSFVLSMVFVYNPLSAEPIKSNIFYLLTGSGFTAVCGGLLYWIVSKIPYLKNYMLKDRNDLEIV